MLSTSASEVAITSRVLDPGSIEARTRQRPSPFSAGTVKRRALSGPSASDAGTLIVAGSRGGDAAVVPGKCGTPES